MDRRLAFVLMTRRAVFAILAVLSTVAALALAYAAFGTTTSGLTPTIALIGIFVLLVFPAITIWAWAWDRKVRKRTEQRRMTRTKPMLVEHAGGRHLRSSHSDSVLTHAEVEQDA